MENIVTNSGIGDFSFYNYPREYSEDDYKEVISRITHRLSKISSLESIYTWGGINDPGISDIDLLLVLKNYKEKFPLGCRTIFSLSRKSRYLIFHPYMVIGKKGFEGIAYIYPDADLNLVYGEKAKARKLPAGIKSKARVCLLSDMILRHYPRDFSGIFLSKKIDVRNTLLRLKSLAKTLKVLQSMKVSIDGSRDYEKEVAELRHEWFVMEEKNKERLLLGLAKKALFMSMEVIRSFDSCFNGFAANKGKKGISYGGSKNKTVFIDGWNTASSLKLTEEFSKAHKSLYSVLPLGIAVNLAEYSKCNGVLSDYIRKNLSASGLEYKTENSIILRKRAEILNAQALLAVKTKHLHFPAFFDFGYRIGIRNLIF